MNIKYYYLLLLGLFWACNSDNPNNSNVENNATAVEKKQPVSGDEEEFERYKDSVINNTPRLLEIKNFVDKNQDQYDQIPFTFTWKGKRYYLPAIGEKAPIDDEQQSFKSIGLITENNDVILPVEYDRLYTPNKILANTIEVRKDGKQGLVTMDGRFILEPVYDRIFPGFDGYLICMFDAEGYAVVKKDSTIERISKEEEKEFLAQLFSEKSLERWNFNVNKDLPFESIASILGDYYFEGGSGWFYPSQFMVDYGFVKWKLANIIISESEHWGDISVNFTVSAQKDENQDFWLLIGNYFKEISDARGYMEERRIMTTINDDNMINTKTFVQGKDFNLCHDSLIFRRVNDTILEAKFQEWGEGTFQSIEAFNYFQLKEGEVIKLHTNRTFASTKFVLIDSTYFKGCWRKRIPEDRRTGGLNVVEYNHLTPEDLDIMRNEIFAEYGYKFKTEKWANYFSQFDWYKPEFDNVDGVLTDIDRENIKYILRYKEWLTKNLNEQIKVDSISWSAAG